MKIQSTGEIWTLETGKTIELTAAEIAEIALHFAPMVDVEMPAIPGPETWTGTDPSPIRGFTALVNPTGTDGLPQEGKL